MIYIIILLITLFLACKYFSIENVSSTIWKRHYLWLGVLVTLLAGLRFYVGADTANYVDDFKLFPTLDKLSISDFSYSRYRPGYILLASACKSIWNNFLLLQLCVACFSNLVILKFIKDRTSSPFVVMLFYFLLNYIEFNFEIMREVTAVSFALISLGCFEKKKYFTAIICIILANLMHVSAFVALLYPLLLHVKYSKFNFFLTVCLSISIVGIYQIVPDLSLYADLIFGYGDYGARYLNKEINQEYNLNFYIFHFTKYFLIPVMALLVTKQNTKYVGFVLAWMLFGILSIVSYAFHRFDNYFSPFIWLLYADAIVAIFKKYRIQKVLLLSFAIVVTITFYQYSLLPIGDHREIYGRYFPYDMVGVNKNYNHNKSQYQIRNN